MNQQEVVNTPTLNIWHVSCTRRIRGRIPMDGLHKFLSEGEGACSITSAGRSHLPLRGKLDG
jgi:hypothetical protein